MRLLATAALIAACIAGAALAQDDAPPPTTTAASFMPQWERRARAGPGAYPTRELERGAAGIVHLCCTARPNRRLDCNVAIEWPENSGFGGSALRFSRSLRLTPESYTALQQQPQQTFQIPFRWHVNPAPVELDGVVARVRALAADVCGPGTGEAPDYIVIEASRFIP